MTGDDMFELAERLDRIAVAVERIAAALEPVITTAAVLPDPCGVREYIGDGVYVTCTLPPDHQGRHQAERVNARPRVWP
jgi:hypothetical protein